jgi:heparan-alpha-glucosaminide N-acetyltransferase
VVVFSEKCPLGVSSPSAGEEGLPRRAAVDRIASIDAGRGLLVTVMVAMHYFDRTSVTPLWLRHIASPDEDAFTIRDFGYPGFLFLVGVSITVAFARRRARGEPAIPMVGRAVLRGLGLVALGRLASNAAVVGYIGEGPWPLGLWNGLAMVAVLALFIRLPSGRRSTRSIALALRCSAIVVLLWLCWMYRGPGGSRFMLYLSRSDVLGSIGISYLLGSLIVLGLGISLVRLGSTIPVFILIYMLSHWESSRGFLASDWVDIGWAFGTIPSIVISGIVAGRILYSGRPQDDCWRRIKQLFLFGFILDLGALLLDPLYGMSELRATPSWALWCSSISCWILGLFYWIMDVRGLAALARFLAPVSRNALLAFLLLWLAKDMSSLFGFPRMTEIIGGSAFAESIGAIAAAATILGLSVAASMPWARIGSSS